MAKYESELLSTLQMIFDEIWQGVEPKLSTHDADDKRAVLPLPSLPRVISTLSVPDTRLADIEASNQAVLDLKDMTSLRVEEQVALKIARDQMNLDLDCSILAYRKTGRFRT
jgi:hypothetical protein